MVGAGVSGAFVAEALTDAGQRVAIVDRRGPLLGSTVASTALLQYEIDTPLIHLSRAIGEERAIRAWRRSRLALDALAARTRDLGIRCDLEPRDTLYLADNLLDAAGLRREAAARRRAGLETRFLDRRALQARFGLRRDAAILSYGNLAADPRRLAGGYLRAAIAGGARLHAPCEITTVAHKRSTIAASTADGHTIRCRHLVYATGYELRDPVPSAGHRIASTWALATAPQPRRLWPEQCFIWEAAEPYLYLRTTADGRVVCGGEDADFADPTKRDALIPAKIATIRRKLGRLLPEIDTTPEFAWAGCFGASETGLPSIGCIPGHRNVWAVMGYGGNGITYSRVAAEIIRSGIAGTGDPDAEVYAFSRRS